MIRKLLNFSLQPQSAVFKAWRKTNLGSFELRLDYDIFRRPNYAFCVYHGARLAERLGIKRISVAEFGVAGGKGLLEFERLAGEVEQLFKVKIDVYGFDTGEGLPEPVDYRDLPYIWKAGFYKMELDTLRQQLERSQLVLGNVKDTVPKFFAEIDAAPLAAASFDLDFWSSTFEAFRIFEAPPEKILPRVFCYCDDVLSIETGGLLNDHVGQLAAIHDYNAANETKKLTPIAGFRHQRRIPAPWNDQIYVHHAFAHPEYNTYVHDDPDRQLRL